MLLVALGVGLAAGIVLSIPPGPIAVAVIHQAIDGRLKRGVGIAAGAATMDALYTLIAVYAGSALVTTMKDFILNNAFVLLGLQIAAVVTFIFMGLRYTHINRKTVEKAEEKEHKQEVKVEKLGGGRNSYLTGIIMSVINLPSPTFLPSLIALATWMHAQNYIGTNVGANVLYSIGFGLGAGLWFVIILRVLRTLRSRLSESFITRIYHFTGISFFLFAAVLLVNVIVSTDWKGLIGSKDAVSPLPAAHQVIDRQQVVDRQNLMALLERDASPVAERAIQITELPERGREAIDQMDLQPDFAGRYRVVTWGCGSPCKMYAIVNVDSRNIVAVFGASYDVEYSLDSPVIVADPPNIVREQERGSSHQLVTTSTAFEIRNDTLYRIGERKLI